METIAWGGGETHHQMMCALRSLMITRSCRQKKSPYGHGLMTIKFSGDKILCCSTDNLIVVS